VISSVLGLVLMFQLERLVVGAGSVTGFADLPAALEPLPGADRSGDDLPLRLGAAGLALAAGVGALVEVVLLQRKARQHLGRPVGVAHQQLRFILPGVLAALVMVGLLSITESLPALVRAPLVLAPGGAVYLAVAHRQGAAEVEAVLSPLRRRLPGRGPRP